MHYIRQMYIWSVCNIQDEIHMCIYFYVYKSTHLHMKLKVSLFWSRHPDVSYLFLLLL